MKKYASWEDAITLAIIIIVVLIALIAITVMSKGLFWLLALPVVIVALLLRYTKLGARL